MPTYDQTDPFREDCARLTTAQQAAFRKGLRIKRVRSRPGVWEMTWAVDGRATFKDGQPVRSGHPHIIWRRVGGHDILDNP